MGFRVRVRARVRVRVRVRVQPKMLYCGEESTSKLSVMKGSKVTDGFDPYR